MKKGDSNSTSEENFEIPSSKIDVENLTETNQLIRSLSGDLQKIETIEIPTTPPTPTKVKSRSRLSSAFRSLRGHGSKKSLSPSVDKSIVKGEFITTPTSIELDGVESKKREPTSPKEKKKKSKLVKKFSLRHLKKSKVSPSNNSVDELFVSSYTQTPSISHRRTPEGGNLSLSQESLIALTSDGPDNEDEDFDETSSSLKNNKVRKFQITISGKRNDRNTLKKNLQTTITEKSSVEAGGATTTEDYLSPDTIEEITATTTASIKAKRIKAAKNSLEIASRRRSDQSGESKVNITQSTRDTPPRERAPARPDPVALNRSENKGKLASVSASSALERTVSPVSPAASNESSRGAIRKTDAKLHRQQSRDEINDYETTLMRQDNSLERGRRYPRPPLQTAEAIADNQQATGAQDTNVVAVNENESEKQKQKAAIILAQSPRSGNNLQNPNLPSFASNDEYREDVVREQPLERQRKIQFAVGEEVDPIQVTGIHHSFADSRDDSSFDNHSTGSQSPDSVSSARRRRIKYIDQKTFYTDEERDILDGKRANLSFLSGISEYSFDSQSSVDATMPAFGDLTIDHEEPPIMTSVSDEKREHLYKILVIGELGTGKTSFIKRYVHQFFSQNYRATIGVDFALKVLHWDQNTIIRLQLWDIAGQERFGNMTRVYYKEAVGAFIVFDVTRSATFDAVVKWKQDLDSKVQLPDGSPIPCILLANKCDQQKQGIVTTPAKMDEYVQENGFAGWFETSAKENVNIEEAARALVNKILLNDKLINASDIGDSDKFALAGSSSGPSAAQVQKKNCSC